MFVRAFCKTEKNINVMQFPKGKAVHEGPELNGPSIRGTSPALWSAPIRLLSQVGGNIRIIRTDLSPLETKALSCPHRNPEPAHSVITLTLRTNAALTIITSPDLHHLPCS